MSMICFLAAFSFKHQYIKAFISGRAILVPTPNFRRFLWKHWKFFINGSISLLENINLLETRLVRERNVWECTTCPRVSCILCPCIHEIYQCNMHNVWMLSLFLKPECSPMLSDVAVRQQNMADIREDDFNRMQVSLNLLPHFALFWLTSLIILNIFHAFFRSRSSNLEQQITKRKWNINVRIMVCKEI